LTQNNYIILAPSISESNDQSSNENMSKPLPFAKNIEMKYAVENIDTIIYDALTKYGESIEHTIKNISCNPHNPIHNNIYADNASLRNNMCKIFNGEKFEHMPKDKGISQLIESHINLIDKYIEDHNDKFQTEKGKRDIKTYKDHIRELNYLNGKGVKSKRKKDLEISILSMLLNIGESINKPEWLKNLEMQYRMYKFTLDHLKSEVFKDRDIILKQLGISNTDKCFESLIAVVEEGYQMGAPSIGDAIATIKSGKRPEWSNIFRVQ